MPKPNILFIMTDNQGAWTLGCHGSGGGSPDLSVDFADILQKDLTIRSNSVFSMASYSDEVEFLLRHPIPLDEIITHRFKLEQAVEAFSLFDSGASGKVIFEWEQ